MAKLAELLVGVRDIGKVPNRKVAKSHFLLVLVLVLVLVLPLEKKVTLAKLGHNSRFHTKNNTNQ